MIIQMCASNPLQEVRFLYLVWWFWSSLCLSEIFIYPTKDKITARGKRCSIQIPKCYLPDWCCRNYFITSLQNSSVETAIIQPIEVWSLKTKAANYKQITYLMLDKEYKGHSYYNLYNLGKEQTTEEYSRSNPSRKREWIEILARNHNRNKSSM